MTVAVICVGETKFVEISVPSSRTDAPGTKSVPLRSMIVASDPAVRALGVTVFTVGTRFCTVKGTAFDAAKVVTVTFPVLEFGGTTTFKAVVDAPVIFAGDPLKSTSVCPGIGSNAAPVIVTVCPHAPVEGVMLLMIGTPTLMATGVIGVSVVPEAAFTFRLYWLTGGAVSNVDPQVRVRPNDCGSNGKCRGIRRAETARDASGQRCYAAQSDCTREAVQRGRSHRVVGLTAIA